MTVTSRKVGNIRRDIALFLLQLSTTTAKKDQHILPKYWKDKHKNSFCVLQRSKILRFSLMNSLTNHSKLFCLSLTFHSYYKTHHLSNTQPMLQKKTHSRCNLHFVRPSKMIENISRNVFDTRTSTSLQNVWIYLVKLFREILEYLKLCLTTTFSQKKKGRRAGVTHSIQAWKLLLFSENQWRKK